MPLDPPVMTAILPFSFATSFYLSLCWTASLFPFAQVGHPGKIVISPAHTGGLSAIVPIRETPPKSSDLGTKKADAIERPRANNHVGLLFNGPPGKIGLPFIQSSNTELFADQAISET
jgi:hypothetical protein